VTVFIHVIGNFLLYIALPLFVIALVLGAISDFIWKKQLHAKMVAFKKFEFPTNDSHTSPRN
jgi:hypothetical protein